MSITNPWGMFGREQMGSAPAASPAPAPPASGGGEGMFGRGLGTFMAAFADNLAPAYGMKMNNLGPLQARMEKQMEEQERKLLLESLSSTDPEVRQKGYAAAVAKGIDPKWFQQQQAAQSLPGVLDATRGETEALDPITANLPKFNMPTAGGGMMEAGGMPVSSGSAPALPKLSIQDAISQYGNPELQQAYAPKMMEQMFAPLTKLGDNERLVNAENEVVVGPVPKPENYNQPFLSNGQPNPAFQKWKLGELAASRPVTNVNNNMGQNGIDYGKPSDGLAWKRDPSGKVVLDDRGAPIAVPYQGGKPYKEEQDNAVRAKNAENTKRITSDIVVQDVDRLLAKIAGGGTTGWVGNKLKDVAGTAAHDVQGLISTIDANLAFDKLQAMRAASPTGGALGNVAVEELNLLKSAVANLKQSQTQDQVVFNANRVKDLYIDTVHGPGASKRMRESAVASPGSLPGTSKIRTYNPATGRLE